MFFDQFIVKNGTIQIFIQTFVKSIFLNFPANLNMSNRVYNLSPF